MPSFRSLDLERLDHGDYALVPLREEDLLPIMHWRNAQIDVLRQKAALTAEQQQLYWQRVILPTFDQAQPSQLLFSYLHQGQLIGYGGLVHLSWEDRRAEVSFLVNPTRAADAEIYAADFSAWLQLMQRVAFEHLSFQRLFTETYDIRPQHVSLLESNGFVLEGRLRRHVIIDGQPVDSLMHGCLSPTF
jgi:RimJ/RimL family protein N-acetyltransferase